MNHRSTLPVGRSLAVAICSLALLIFAAAPGAAHAKRRAPQKAAPPTYSKKLLKAMKWREVGPYRGGRADAVTGVAGEPETYYFGSSGGGVWKTVDGGQSWQNVSDGFFGGSIGAVAVSTWDPNVVYVGTGEETVRGNVSAGNGMWKSLDAGKTWTHIGLDDSRHISRIRIDPKDPDRVYVAAMGHLFGPNKERGIYRSEDGGKSWKQVLFVNDSVGAVDLAMDPDNARILYATFWRIKREPWSFESGGPGSSLWKSTDGGDHWEDITHNKGLPQGTIGISGISVSRSQPDNVYAIIESKEGGVFRSRDGGKTWTKTNSSNDLRQRAWYYTRIYADPKDADSVYVVNVSFEHSKDGGHSFSSIRTPHGDNHDLWIAPDDPCRMIEANDGGANISTDCGKTWSTEDNQPTAQIYRVATDDHFPYRIYGAQQDNSALRIDSRSAGRSITRQDWQITAGGESGYIVPDPTDNDVVFGGSYGGYLVRYNHRTDEVRDVNPWPDNPMGWGAADLKYRFQWNFPIFFSPNDPHTLYAAANVLFKSTDGGGSWQQISPDLTRNDKSKQGPAGGPITKDNTSVEYYDTIFTALEVPGHPESLWAGSDDGLIHLSRDGGKTWQDVTPPNMPKWIQINSIEANPFVPGGLYVAATMYKLDDFRPYLYKTDDWGKTWTKITNGIADHDFTRVIRADPVRRGLLFAGTENGLYASFDDGASWQPLQLNLPLTPVTDLTIKRGDLVAATQGRGFWVLDDLSALRQITPAMLEQPFHLFTPAPVYRLTAPPAAKTPHGAGTNPPNGLVVRYLLNEKVKGQKVKLEILDSQGKVLRSFTSAKPKNEKETAKKDEKKSEPAAKKATEAGKESAAKAKSATGKKMKSEEAKSEGHGLGEKEPKAPAETGLNQFVWNLRMKSAKKFPGMVLWDRWGLAGPLVVPGDYQVRLTVGGQSQTEPFKVLKDPRVSASQHDLEAQYAFLLGLRDEISRAHEAVRHIREVKGQIDALRKRLHGEEQYKDVISAADKLWDHLDTIEKALYQTQNRAVEDPLNFPIRLDDKLAGLAATVGTGQNAPTAQAEAVRKILVGETDAQLAKLGTIWQTDLPAFNRLVSEQNVPAIAFHSDENKKEKNGAGEKP